ncbi:hypothetical protein [Pseudomonas sp. SWRI154]|uniref:hypothetical protein n=1 Tax=Pseudomonas sp. SWRI154 TaxID=2745501 RepID=UPI00164542E6|nr:hypothetical protein [Pseudomonas sp. SWRI154]MBC3365025.1 hypothetical protein [Pseudomonas sp. SWRI154]
MDNKSFEATLRMFDAHVNLLEILHGQPTLATVSAFSGGFYSGRPQTHDHSNLLGMRPKGQGITAAALTLQFRPTAGGYNLVIKNTGKHYDKFISQSWSEVFGAKGPDTKTPTVFTLLDHQNRTITRESITAVHLPVSLRTQNNNYIGALKVRGSPYLYLAESEGKSKITFILSLL